MHSRSTFRPRSELVTSRGGTQKGSSTGDRSCRANRVGRGLRQIRGPTKAETGVRADLKRPRRE
jgi:hypothetical protein